MPDKDQTQAGGTPGNTPDPNANGGTPPAGAGAGKKDQTQAGGTPGVPVTYRCKVKCHYGGRLYRVGEVLVTDKEAPGHFEKVK